MTPRSIAANRFGLGARPGEAVGADPRGWLTAQLGRYRPRPPALADSIPNGMGAKILADYLLARRALRREAPGATAAAAATDPDAELRRTFGLAARRLYAEAVAARVRGAAVSDTPFADRLVYFWSNHFAVAARTPPLRALVGGFETDAIRPHIMGRFADLLRAAEQHPAMLIYLDQIRSVGPDSADARRRAAKKTLGLNENLAREIMELHTVGVRTGYTQDDVTELARALTGWGSAGVSGGGGGGTPGDFRFNANRHQPGVRTVLGKVYPAAGAGQGEAILADLAIAPATARHLAVKLTRHFAGAPEPPAMVDRLAAAFVSSGGDLPTVYRALIASPEAWVERPVRFRTPWDWAVATLRAVGAPDEAEADLAGIFVQLGQPVWLPLQPSGWDDDDATWLAADGLMRRVEEAERVSQRRSTPVDARRLADILFPGAVTAATAQALARAESPAQGLALLLCSPEMMRR